MKIILADSQSKHKQVDLRMIVKRFAPISEEEYHLTELFYLASTDIKRHESLKGLKL